MGWVTGNYNKKAFGKEAIVTKLNFIGSTRTGYNVFQDVKGNNYVVFSDHPNLLRTVMNCAEANNYIIIGLMKDKDIKYSYTTELPDVGEIEVRTIARVIRIRDDRWTHEQFEVRY
jgi:hypothetical protein